MSFKLIVRPEAEEDILDAALWYEGREAGLGLELTTCVASSRDDFHIVSFASFGRTPSLFSQSCMLPKTNGIGWSDWEKELTADRGQ